MFGISNTLRHPTAHRLISSMAAKLNRGTKGSSPASSSEKHKRGGNKEAPVNGGRMKAMCGGLGELPPCPQLPACPDRLHPAVHVMQITDAQKVAFMIFVLTNVCQRCTLAQDFNGCLRQQLPVCWHRRSHSVSRFEGFRGGF